MLDTAMAELPASGRARFQRFKRFKAAHFLQVCGAVPVPLKPGGFRGTLRNIVVPRPLQQPMKALARQGRVGWLLPPPAPVASAGAAVSHGELAQHRGALLLWDAVADFRAHPRGEEQPKMPKWMATVD